MKNYDIDIFMKNNKTPRQVFIRNSDPCPQKSKSNLEIWLKLIDLDDHVTDLGEYGSNHHRVVFGTAEQADRLVNQLAASKEPPNP